MNEARSHSDEPGAGPLEWIWSQEQLLGFTNHQDDTVRAWAVGHLVRLAPQALTGHVTRLLLDPSAEVRDLLDGLLDIPEFSIPVDLLQARLKDKRLDPGQQRLIGRWLAASEDPAIWSRLGTSTALAPFADMLARRAPRECHTWLARLAARSIANFPADLFPVWVKLATPSEIPCLLDVVEQTPDNPTDDDGLSDQNWLADQLLARATATWFSLPSVQREAGLVALVKQIGAILKERVGEVAKLPNLGDLASVDHLVRKRKWEKALPSATRLARALWDDTTHRAEPEWRAGFIDAFQRRRPSPLLVNMALGVLLETCADWINERQATVCSTFSKLCSLWRLSSPGQRRCLIPDLRRLWAPLAEVTAQPEPRQQGHGRSELEQATQSMGSLLSSLRNDEDMRELSELIDQLPGFPLEEAFLELHELEAPVHQYLSTHPELLRRLATRTLGNKPAWNADLFEVLANQPVRWVSELIRERLDKLLSQGASPECWTCIREVADPTWRDLVLAEWRPGENDITRCAMFLATLTASRHTLPDPVRQAGDLAERCDERLDGVLKQAMSWMRGTDPEADDVRDERAGQAALDAWRSEPLILALRCTLCGRTYHYQVPGAVLHPGILDENVPEEGWDGVTLGCLITCKQCGAVDRYELTASAQKALLMDGTIGRLAAQREDTDAPPRVQFGIAKLFDGTLMKRPREGLEHLRSLSVEQPENSELCRRLGNLQFRYGLPDDAEKSWRKAVETGPNEVEAAYSLTELLWESQHQEAFQFLRLALTRLPMSDMEPGLRCEVAAQLVHYLAQQAPYIDPPAAITMMSNEGEVNGQLIVRMSSVDLRRIRGWDRLVDLLSSKSTIGVGFTTQLPDEVPTMLEDYLNGPSEPMDRPYKARPAARTARAKTKQARKQRRKIRR